ncbi:MAG: DUF456 domain-containing protein [Anaerolineae bacterium]|nr:DUF456 domain-containing protein [Anaerolineae bacterium]
MPAWIATISMVLIILTMVVGQLGLFIPIFPGNVIIWTAALIYGLIFGFGTLGGVLFGVLTFFMVIAVLADNFFMGAKAREKGAAWPSVIAALGAAIVFTFVFPPIGGLIAAPLVLYLLENRRLGDSQKTMEIVKAMMWGLGLSFVTRFTLGLAMIVLWSIWAIAG